MAEQRAGIIDQAKRLGGGVIDAGRSVWLVGLGALATAGDETRGMIDRLRDRGAEFERSDANAVRKAYNRAAGEVRHTGSRVEDAVRSTVSSALHRAGVPSHDEIRELIDRVEQLTAKVDSLGDARRSDHS